MRLISSEKPNLVDRSTLRGSFVFVRPGVYVLSTGTELSSGRSIDTNAPEIARACSEQGFPVVGLGTMPDDRALLESEIGHVLARSDVGIVIMTGGLGPTDDDHTVDALAGLSGRDIVDDPQAARKLEVLGKRSRGRLNSASARRQVRIVEGAHVLMNERGLAPGMLLEISHGTDSRLVAAMPGVPQEMRHMLATQLLPELTRRYPEPGRARVVLHVYSVGESAFQSRVFGDKEKPGVVTDWPDDFSWGITAGNGQLKLFFEASDAAALNRIRSAIETEYSGQVLPASAEEILHDLLPKKQLTIGAAESCTGGLIGKILTDRPGSSAYFVGSIVAYSNSIKQALLGVPESVLNEFGAVSDQCVRAMAVGARERLASNYAVAVTGIAGPDGGSEHKPVGTVFVGVSGPSGCESHELHIPLDRDRVRHYTAHLALFHLLRFIEKDT